MELPQNVLALIKEYSLPLTRPDWRNRKWISISTIYFEAARKKEKADNTNLYIRFLLNTQNEYQWNQIYYYYYHYGPKHTIIEHGITTEILSCILDHYIK